MSRWMALLLAIAAPAWAEVADLSDFARLPVQSGGRVMPMDTFARMQLLEITGKSTFHAKPAVGWLAQLVFTPDAAHTQAVFLVNNPEVLEAIDIRATAERARYSYSQLEPGIDALRVKARRAFDVPEKERTAFEREIIRLFHSLNTYVSLSHSFAFTRPDADFAVTNAYARTKLGLPADREVFSFLDIYFAAPRAAAEVEAIGKRPQTEWSADQRALFDVSSQLYRWSQFYQDLPITMLPVEGHGKGSWLSPWDALGVGFASDALREDLARMQDLAGAYASGKQADFRLAANALERSILKRAAGARGVEHLNLELLSNKLDFFYRAEMLYGFAFFAALITVLVERPAWRKVALVLIVLALVPHTAGIASRMAIMSRPPVTNLYSTFLFVAWVSALLGLAVEAFQRNALGALISSLGGLSMLLIARRFDDSGDSMGVMIAVLDSNFWLSTHVVSITIGYAGCVAAGLAGHIYLLKALRRPPGDPQLAGLSRAVFGLLAFGLVFSFLGTMLGGVWADQSWGRFWGWDPKENGALLIVLWCALLFHARIARWIGDRGMAAGSVLGVIVVLMAWLGINLLGVGLHSYGFTSSLAIGFWSAVSAEILFVVAVLPFVKRA